MLCLDPNVDGVEFDFEMVALAQLIYGLHRIHRIADIYACAVTYKKCGVTTAGNYCLLRQIANKAHQTGQDFISIFNDDEAFIPSHPPQKY